MKFSDKVSTGLILIFLALVSSYSGIFNRVDNVLYDLGQKLYSRHVADDVVIIAVDELSLTKFGRWPWSREIHAQLVNRLHQESAKVIALDFIFSEPDVNSPKADQALAHAIKTAGNVVLPVLIESARTNGQLIETLPLTELAEGAAELGRVHVQLDADGIARGVYLWEGLSEPSWPLFAQATLKVADDLPKQYALKINHLNNPSQLFTLVRQDYRGISFVGPPGSFRSISYSQVVAGTYAKDLFKNKIVLVGATAAGMGDVLPTPVSGLSQPMSGVEFHANVLQAMREQRFIKQISPYLTLFICALFALAPMLWLPKISPFSGLLASSLMLILVVTFAMSLPNMTGYWFAPTGALTALILAYPIWSWRKLESANRFLDTELALMRDDLAALGLDLNKKIISNDPFQSRILQVQTASEQLRQMQMHRRETLAFISHDIRAPLAAAVMQLDELVQGNGHLRASLARAHNLAEEFLHTSRAEMSNASRFQELDLAAVFHQAADDAFSHARAKSVTFLREISEDPVWVKGEFGLLHRAILNLIGNAIKYAPRHSQITLRLQSENNEAVLSVIDCGQGISKEQQAQLFKRFNRIETNQEVPMGSGLGLYFVRTVAEKHGGDVGIESEQGMSTCFTIRMPLHN